MNGLLRSLTCLCAIAWPWPLLAEIQLNAYIDLQQAQNMAVGESHAETTDCNQLAILGAHVADLVQRRAAAASALTDALKENDGPGATRLQALGHTLDTDIRRNAVLLQLLSDEEIIFAERAHPNDELLRFVLGQSKLPRELEPVLVDGVFVTLPDGYQVESSSDYWKEAVLSQSSNEDSKISIINHLDQVGYLFPKLYSDCRDDTFGQKCGAYYFKERIPADLFERIKLGMKVRRREWCAASTQGDGTVVRFSVRYDGLPQFRDERVLVTFHVGDHPSTRIPLSESQTNAYLERQLIDRLLKDWLVDTLGDGRTYAVSDKYLGIPIDQAKRSALDAVHARLASAAADPTSLVVRGYMARIATPYEPRADGRIAFVYKTSTGQKVEFEFSNSRTGIALRRIALADETLWEAPAPPAGPGCIDTTTGNGAGYAVDGKCEDKEKQQEDSRRRLREYFKKIKSEQGQTDAKPFFSQFVGVV